MGTKTERGRGRKPPVGHLVIIGGGEDRKNDKAILSRFIQLAGGPESTILVLTAASTEPREMWQIYDEAFGALGVERRAHLEIRSRDEAGDAERAEKILHADGVFMTGGDQKRLLATIGGTLIDRAMHRVFRTRGACIAGTSAGASAMSEHMLATSDAHGGVPARDATHLAAGLGFLQRVVIDQHFSERQRLGRLLGIVAQNAYLLGIGIDENTALLVESGTCIEVVGKGAVTLIDGREMRSNFLDVAERERFELINVKLHLIPSGVHYALTGGADAVPPGLREAVAAVTSVSATPRPEAAQPAAEPVSEHEDR